jgi:hypothetical protein
VRCDDKRLPGHDLGAQFDTTHAPSPQCYMGANSRLKVLYTCGRVKVFWRIPLLLYAWGLVFIEVPSRRILGTSVGPVRPRDFFTILV